MKSFMKNLPFFGGGGQILKVWSHLSLFSEFLWGKSSNFSRYPRHLEFHMRVKNVPLQISQQVGHVNLLH